MSDVIISDMEMPENCNKCRLLGDGRWCWAIAEDETQPGATREDKRPDWCPLRPVPERERPITSNADRIRAMSDEELAMFFDSTCTENMGSVRCDIGLGCYDCWLDWLKQEARDD